MPRVSSEPKPPRRNESSAENTSIDANANRARNKTLRTSTTEHTRRRTLSCSTCRVTINVAFT
jgi:hypothetical protein